MAEISYVGVNGVARKITDMYVGVNGVARKVAYAYVGVNGVARKIYSSIKIKPFTSNIFPTSWTYSAGTTLNASSNNEYGNWYINSDTTSTSSTAIDRAFDGNTNTYFLITSYTSSNKENVSIQLPTNVYINPTTISVTHRRLSSSSKIQGFNTESNEWVDLGSLNNYSTKQTQTIAVSGDTYYSKFRINCYSINSSSLGEIYEFQITNGNIKYKG